MLSQEIVKMEITSHYHFNDDFFHATFVIDFDSQKAYWDSKYFKDIEFWKDFYQREGLGEYKRNEHWLFRRLDDRVTHKEYALNNADKFLSEIEKRDIFNRFEPCEPTGSLLGHIEFLNVFYIYIYSKDLEEYHVVKWKFPGFWREFGELLENLVGFDVLNISDSKYFISNLNYDVSNDWIVDNACEELVLNKIRFNYFTHMIGDWTNWEIDFSNKTLTLRHEFNDEITESVSDDILNQLKGLLKKHHVFSWNLKESWSNLPGGCWVIKDGHSWRLEFEFDNGAVFNIGGGGVNTDEYLDFAKEVKYLFDFDLMRYEDRKGDEF